MNNQTAAWGDIHTDHKTEDRDGTRWVLDHVDGVGTCLVRWHGPSIIGPDGFTRLAEGEPHIQQPTEARGRAEDRIGRAERLIDSWEHDAPGHSNPVFIGRLRECLRRDAAPVRLRGADEQRS